jgi:hypothetical protein
VFSSGHRCLAAERTDQAPRRAKRAAVGCIRKFDAREHRPLQQRSEVISVDFAIAENGRQETRADGLTGVDGYDSSTAVGMAEKVVAALDP